MKRLQVPWTCRTRVPVVPVFLIVSVEQTAKPAEDRAFLASAAPHAWNGLHDAVGHPTERQRLQPHASGASERREEETLTAEDRGLDLADVFDVVLHRGL